MKKEAKRAVYIGVTIVLVIVALVLVYNSQKDSECKTDADCVKAVIGCCPCNMGGEEQCLPQDKVPMFKCPAPDKLICTQVDNCKIASCRCERGKCTD